MARDERSTGTTKTHSAECAASMSAFIERVERLRRHASERPRREVGGQSAAKTKPTSEIGNARGKVVAAGMLARHRSPPGTTAGKGSSRCAPVDRGSPATSEELQ